MSNALDGLTNRGLTLQNRNLVHELNSEVVTCKIYPISKNLDDHLSKDCRYDPFQLTNMSSEDKSRLSSFFTSIHDQSHYQAADRSGTYSNKGEDLEQLIYDDDYEHRHCLRAVQIGINKEMQHNPMWQEQFDHVSKDFLSSLKHDGHDFLLNNLEASSWNKVQKWWELFGKYWSAKNCHNNNNVKVMGWLMNGVGHGTVDMCGETVSMITLLLMKNLVVGC